MQALINNEQYDEVAEFVVSRDILHFEIETLLEDGKISEECYNKLIENPEYKKIKEKYDKEHQENLEELIKISNNPFLLFWEWIGINLVYPIIRFINKFKERLILKKSGDIKTLAEIMETEEIKKQKKYESLNKKVLQVLEQKGSKAFVEIYETNLDSINEKIEAISSFMLQIYEPDKLIEFRKDILNTENKNFIYLFDCAMFQCGLTSPEEFIQSIEDGIKKQIPMAYAIKSNFYKYGLEVFEPCLEAIKKAIMLEPNNLEYKKMLKDIEQDEVMNDEQNM